MIDNILFILVLIWLKSPRNVSYGFVPGEWQKNRKVIFFLFEVLYYTYLFKIVSRCHGGAKRRLILMYVINVDLWLLSLGVYTDVGLMIDISHARGETTAAIGKTLTVICDGGACLGVDIYHSIIMTEIIKCLFLFSSSRA